MNSHALEVLEFRAALDVVGGYAASQLGRDAVRGLGVSSEISSVRRELQLTAEGMALHSRGGGWSMPKIPALHEALSRLRLEGYTWDGPTLNEAAQLVASARTARRILSPVRSELPTLAALSESLHELPGLAEAVGRVVAEDGAVRDGASPELHRLRRQIQGARGRIVSRLTEYAAALPPHYQVSDASISIREGRYVVPVRREARGEVGGIVHGESQTGATLFVEPPVAIEMMNRLRELEAEESREVHRLLRETTAAVRPHADALVSSLDALVQFDTVYARARYAIAVDGHLPELMPIGSHGLRIVHGRHPLLLARGEAVVPFDLEMVQGERTLIISGPNTGGKTVLLKGVGLISLLAQAGVIPPVGPATRLAIFGSAFADIGDEQSIEASLSTFSAHLRNLRETLNTADAGALVLIDEIGSGTDPVEGAALAQAILMELNARGAFTIATTHLGALKLLAAENPGVVNASLQFDAERLQPTYRLLKGVPGRSYGLAIARRLGLPEGVLASAESALPQGERDVGRLLLELEAREQRYATLNHDLEVELAKARALRAEYEERERALERREKDSERRSRQQARDLLMRSRDEVEAAIQEVRGAADEAALSEAARGARRRVEEAAKRQRERTPDESRRSIPATSSREPLVIGARVRIESLGRAGTLLELRDARAVVDAGGLRMQISAADLTMLPAGDQGADAPRVRPRPFGGRIDAEMDARPEVDLRGLRVDEMGLRLARAMDAAMVAGLPTFRIIHGKGTGALRHEVEELLRGDPRIASYRPGDRFEGGTGVTVVEFT